MTKPLLKAIAKTPVIPVVIIKIESEITSAKSTFTWMGAALKEPAGDELSAFGVSFESGGVALITIPDNSLALKLGFKSGDLIQEVNGFKIRNIQNLKAYIGTSSAANKQHVFQIIRNQGKMEIVVKQVLPELVEKEQ